MGRLVGIWAGWLCAASAVFGQASAAGPVVELRRTLETRFASLEERDAAIAEHVAAVEETADLVAALQLKEWRVDDLDVNLAEVDRAGRHLVCQRFLDDAVAILREGPDGRRLALFQMLRALETSSVAGELGVLIPEMTRLTACGNQRVRLQAVHCLGAIPVDHGKVLPYFDILLEATEPSLRLAAADALHCLLARWRQRALQARTGDEKNALRGDLIDMAGAVMPAVMRNCQDPDVAVRKAAIRAVHEGLQTLRAVLMEQDAAKQAAETFVSLLDALRGPRIFLVRTLHDIDVDVRIQARLALEELAVIDKQAHSDDAAVHPTALDETVEQATASNSLEEWRAALPELIAGVGDRDIRARLRAIDILEALGPVAESAMPALRTALQDNNRFVRWSAARALARIGPAAPEETVPALEKLLMDDDLDVRVAAARSLASYGPKAQTALNGLLEALTVKSSEQRLAVLRVLHGIGPAGAPAVPTLCACLADIDPSVRCKSAAVLGDLGPLARPAVDVLRQSLSDDDADVRHAAGKALLLIDRDASSQPLADVPMAEEGPPNANAVPKLPPTSQEPRPGTKPTASYPRSGPANRKSGRPAPRDSAGKDGSTRRSNIPYIPPYREHP